MINSKFIGINFIDSFSKSLLEVTNCYDNFITKFLGFILARDDLVTLCENNVNLLDKVSNWWFINDQNMLTIGFKFG